MNKSEDQDKDGEESVRESAVRITEALLANPNFNPHLAWGEDIKNGLGKTFSVVYHALTLN